MKIRRQVSIPDVCFQHLQSRILCRPSSDSGEVPTEPNHSFFFLPFWSLLFGRPNRSRSVPHAQPQLASYVLPPVIDSSSHFEVFEKDHRDYERDLIARKFSCHTRNPCWLHFGHAEMGFHFSAIQASLILFPFFLSV